MGNPFLVFGTKDIATAKLYEKAIVANLEEIFHTNAPALTNGKKIYINTEDNLFKTFPDYNIGMLKWLLWHEEQHINLKHHDRFFRYISKLKESDLLDKFKITKDEVNIIMDILVHDSLCNWFPELIETAKTNYAQLRNRNSLGYTFKTFTLEEMLDEYKEFKKSDDHDETDKDKTKDKTKDKEEKTTDDGIGEEKEDESKTGRKPSKKKDDEEDDNEFNPDESNPGGGEHDEHDEVDWDKAEEIDSDEFITEEQAEEIEKAVEKIRRKKLKLAKITETLNGLATGQRVRTYATPSRLQVGKGIILKGRKPGKAKLYLIFDASGSMNNDMIMFKDIIQKSIPQAMESPCEWFSGDGPREVEHKCRNHEGRNYDYYKGKFKDFIEVTACGGYSDDGDRTIELCLKAEEKGYNPIGVTDGGWNLKNPENVKKLKRTILVGNHKGWLENVKKLNSSIQILCTKD